MHELAHHQEYLKDKYSYVSCEESHQRNGAFSDFYRFVASRVAIVYPLLYEKNIYEEDLDLGAIKKVYHEAIFSSKVLESA